MSTTAFACFKINLFVISDILHSFHHFENVSILLLKRLIYLFSYILKLCQYEGFITTVEQVYFGKKGDKERERIYLEGA